MIASLQTRACSHLRCANINPPSHRTTPPRMPAALLKLCVDAPSIYHWCPYCSIHTHCSQFVSSFRRQETDLQPASSRLTPPPGATYLQNQCLYLVAIRNAAQVLGPKRTVLPPLQRIPIGSFNNAIRGLHLASKELLAGLPEYVIAFR
jgi:hypothetical protein